MTFEGNTTQVHVITAILAVLIVERINIIIITLIHIAHKSIRTAISFPEHARSRINGGALTRERGCLGNEIVRAANERPVLIVNVVASLRSS